MLTKVGLRMQAINLKVFITTLFIWAVTAVAAQNSIEIVVHRGANALAPENTIASTDSALKYGAKWIELDVRKSKDGVLFNLHDETLDRTTNGKGKLVRTCANSMLAAGLVPSLPTPHSLLSLKCSTICRARHTYSLM